MAQLSYRFIELPFIGLGRRLAATWRTRSGQQPVSPLIELTQE